jgi:SPP1 gp7 family putative phage head morphogenesis protein
MAGTTEGQGLISRVTTALRYALTGNAPDWFGPATPLPPQAPEEVRGRAWDYSTALNLSFRPRGTEPIGFEGLKKLASHPIVTMLIQRQKDKICALDWQIKPRGGEASAKADAAALQAITDFFRYPDQEHDWGQWIGAVLDQLLVIDAVTIYGAPTRRGDLYALQIIDGATITPVIDFSGRRPLAPTPAYQQIIKGLPAIDYTADEMIYFPQVYRADRRYGYSRVEQARDLIEMAISRLRSQKGYFDFGNLGDGYFVAPENWQPDQILGLEAKWNSYMQGDPAIRRVAPFMPAGSEWKPTKVDLLADAFDEFIIRLLCFPFGVAPQPFLKQTGLGHGSADSEHEAAEEGGIAPLMQYVARLMTMIIAKWFDRPDVEFAWVEDREFDPKTAAEIDDIRLKNGSRTINEVRDRNGEKPLENGDKPMIYTGTGPILLEEAVLPTPEPQPIVASPPVPGVGEAPGAGGEPGGATADDTAPEAELKKAADAAAQQRFAILFGAYLKTKAETLATAIADKLVKAAPMDDRYVPIDDAFDEIDWDWSDLPPLVQPVLAGVAVAAGTDAVSALGLFDTDTLKRVSARSTAWAQDRAAELVGMKWIDGELVENPDATWSITETTRTMLNTLVRNAMDEGQSNQELAASIRDSVAFSPERASLVARTETAMADVQGAIIGWKESGVVTGKQFLAAPDCCDDCQVQDGEIVGLDEEFSEGDAPLHPNCRCSVIAVLADDASDESADETDETED